MDTLKEIIKENQSAFNKQMPPFGSLFRFIQKLTNRKSFSWVLYPALASIAIIISLTVFIPNGEEQAIRVYKQYCYEVGVMSGEIQAMSSEKELYLLDLALDRITFEAVPLLDELPEELSGREKAKLMKAYYKKKLDGVAKLKALVANAEDYDY